MNFVVNRRYFQDKNAYKKGLKILLLVYALPILLFILPFVAFPISLGLTLLLRTNLPSEAVLAVLMNNDYLHCIQIFFCINTGLFSLLFLGVAGIGIYGHIKRAIPFAGYVIGTALASAVLVAGVVTWVYLSTPKEERSILPISSPSSTVMISQTPWE